MNYRRIDIDDDSDCATCTALNELQWEMLQQLRCELLTNLSCPECDREIAIFVEAERTSGGER
jgi:hypothetical protein